MATVNFINRTKSQSRAGLRAVLRYTMKIQKTESNGYELVSGLDCSPESVYEEFINTKLLHGKDDGRMYYHFVQSFPKDEVLTPETAHEIAMKLAEFYKGFEVLVSTHTDREHLHSHFIINSVNFETGKKLHQSASAIGEIRQKSDELCKKYGLSICEPRAKDKQVKSMSIGEYHLAVKGKSFKFKLINVIEDCMKLADSKQTFIALMESEGIKVKWTDGRKNITYELADGKRCRDNKLFEDKFLKERMELEFEYRQAIIKGRAEEFEQAYESVADDRRRLGSPSEQSGSDIQISQVTTEDSGSKSREDTKRDSQRAEDDTGDTRSLVTGWEEERNEFFTAENQVAYDTSWSGNDNVDVDISDVCSSAIHCAKTVEQALNDGPIKDCTTQIVVTERKKGQKGQKKEEQNSQEYKYYMGM